MIKHLLNRIGNDAALAPETPGRRTIERHIVDMILDIWHEPPTTEKEWSFVTYVYYLKDPYPTGSSAAGFVVGLRSAA